MTGFGIRVVGSLLHICGIVRDVYTYSKPCAFPVDVDDTTVVLLHFDGSQFGYFGTVMATAPARCLQVFGTDGWAEMQGHEILAIAPRGCAIAVRTFDLVDTERAGLESFADVVTGEALYPVLAEDAVHGVAVLEVIVT